MQRADITLAPLTSADLLFVWALLSDAAVDAGLAPFDPETAEHAPFAKYLQGWGRPGDEGVVASVVEGGRVGAAWYRLFTLASREYGFVAADTPELSIRLLAPYRDKGIGGALLSALIRRAAEQGFGAISLSVDRQNPARRLYARHGFVEAGVTGPAETSVTLIKRISSA